jgi:nitric oxide reductase subunit B
MENMVWLRVPGDIVFAIGTVFLALFALRLLRAKRETVAHAPETAANQV